MLSDTVFMLTLTIGVYLFSLYLYRKSGWRILHPLVTSILLIIPILKATGIPYEAYRSANRPIDFFLGVSVVAVGYLLYDKIKLVRERMLSIVVSVAVGCVVGVVSIIWIARWFGADPTVIASLQPKQATTPIAVSISENSGGNPSLTSVVVIAVGIFGGIAGPYLLDKMGVRNRIARGLALGSAAHAVGTARAIELGAIEGAVSGLAIGLMGLLTSLSVPLLEKIV